MRRRSEGVFVRSLLECSPCPGPRSFSRNIRPHAGELGKWLGPVDHGVTVLQASRTRPYPDYAQAVQSRLARDIEAMVIGGHELPEPDQGEGSGPGHDFPG